MNRWRNRRWRDVSLRVDDVQDDPISDDERLDEAADVLQEALDDLNRARAMDGNNERAVREREEALADAVAALEEASVDVERVHDYYAAGDERCANCESNVVVVESRRERTYICRECGVTESETRSDANVTADKLALAGVGIGAVAFFGPWYPRHLGAALIVLAVAARLLVEYGDEWRDAVRSRLQEVAE